MPTSQPNFGPPKLILKPEQLSAILSRHWLDEKILPFAVKVQHPRGIKWLVQFLYQCGQAQSCPALWGPVDYSPRLLCPWILQERVLEWVAISTPRNLPKAGIEASSLACSHWQSGLFTASASCIAQTVTPPAVAWIMPTWWWAGRRILPCCLGPWH